VHVCVSVRVYACSQDFENASVTLRFLLLLPAAVLANARNYLQII
jgi:hypothetical protein